MRVIGIILTSKVIRKYSVMICSLPGDCMLQYWQAHPRTQTLCHQIKITSNQNLSIASSTIISTNKNLRSKNNSQLCNQELMITK